MFTVTLLVGMTGLPFLIQFRVSDNPKGTEQTRERKLPAKRGPPRESRVTFTATVLREYSCLMVILLDAQDYVYNNDALTS